MLMARTQLISTLSVASKMRMPPDMSRTVRIPSDMSRTQENMLMQSVVQFLLAKTLNNIYNLNWREVAISKWMVSELLRV